LNLALALVSALLLVLIFPRFNLIWLAPVALTPLLVAAARERRALRRFLIGEAAGIVYWFGVCYWIQFVLAVHGGMSEAAAWGAFLLFCLAKALHMAVFTLLAGFLISRPYAIPAVAALWVGIERTHGPLGFAWLALGNAGITMSTPMRLAPWIGVYGLSFVFAMMAAALALVILRRPRRELLWLAVLPLMYLLPQLPRPERGHESAVLVQLNVSEDQTWTEPAIEHLQRSAAYLSLQTALHGGTPPQLIIWPEVPAPLYYDSDPQFHDRADNLARLAHTYFLFGTVAFTPSGAPLNSAMLVSPAGEPVARYDKMFLVPFGEFVPPLFNFVNRITKEAGDFVPGRKVVVFNVGQHHVGAFICYESVFPHLVRRFVAAGAEVLVNLSNDGYFGRTAARDQHLRIVRMRAAENRRWILRSTNDGITASIDPAGRIVQRLPPFTQTAARMNFSYLDSLTFYTRFGDWFAWLCLVASFVVVVIAWRWPGGKINQRS
jgi:apolipoprotein N-acyltransferase